MRRREFVLALAATQAGLTVVARAQERAIPVIGWLSMRTEADSAFAVAAVRAGLAETGYIEGRNLAIEYRWLENNHDLLPSVVAELVERRVALIAVIGSSVAALAARAATATIPIVFANGGDPVRDGLVSSLNRPGGNVTGVSFSPWPWDQSGSSWCTSWCGTHGR